MLLPWPRLKKKRAASSGCSYRPPLGIHLVVWSIDLFRQWWPKRTSLDHPVGCLLGEFLELGVLPRGEENRIESASE
jgi:hypothetical protein